jgi:thymidylate kinase
MSFLKACLDQSFGAIVLITVSGMVGSGKTTTVHAITAFAEAHGLDAHAHRFQSLPCITPRPRRRAHEPSAGTAAGRPTTSASATRWSGYSRKRLGITAVAVFVARIMAFRVYRRTVWSAAEWTVLNRYFYDSLSHYQPRSSLERVYYRTILALIPRPDLAILVTANRDTIAERRPAYAKAYIDLVGESYRHLASQVDDLIELSTEANATAERLTAILRTHVR